MSTVFSIEDLLTLWKGLTPGEWLINTGNKIYANTEQRSGFVCSVASDNDIKAIVQLPEILKELIEYHYAADDPKKGWERLQNFARKSETLNPGESITDWAADELERLYSLYENENN